LECDLAELAAEALDVQVRLVFEHDVSLGSLRSLATTVDLVGADGVTVLCRSGSNAAHGKRPSDEGGTPTRRSPLRVSRRWEIGRGMPATTAPLEEPGPTLLAGHVALEESLDDLSVGAYEDSRRKLGKERQRGAPRSVGLELLSTIDLEPKSTCQRHHGVDATGVRARDDAFDAMTGKRLRQALRDCAPVSVEGSRTIERGTGKPLTCAGVS